MRPKAFYRAEGAPASAIRGLGIGLGLVDSIVKQHHGLVTIRSPPGQGTTLTVDIPIAHTSLPLTPERRDNSGWSMPAEL